MQLPSGSFSWPVAAALVSMVASPGAAQVVRLVTPNATISEEFSSIRGIRELRDGRILVSDYLDQRVVLVDFERQTVTQRVSKGGGPTEARLPTRLIPARGDSTLLVDLGNNRLLLLDGSGRPIRTIAAVRPGVLGVRGLDPSGALYFAVPGWSEGGNALPSRFRPGGSLEPGDRRHLPGCGGSRRTDAIRHQGAVPNPADRTAFVRRFLTQSPTSGKGENGGMGFSPIPNEAEIVQMTHGTQFAERHPMFNAGDVLLAPGGKLWVGRPAAEGQPAPYDVFDAGGRRVTTVELKPGRRVMAVGTRGVYAVAESEVGIQVLERYPVPQ